MTKLTVNGRSVELNEGSTLLDAIREAGVHIPILCYYPRLPSHAVCRMCLVEVAGEARPQPACVTKAKEGNVVETDSAELQEFRKADAEWLLARHPSDCMRCEVNGSCKLQSLVGENQWEDKWANVPRGSVEHPEHILTDHTSPSIWRDLSKCIECGLCVEACGDQGQQQYVIGFAEHGSGRLPVTVFDQSLADTQCISCGQCTLVCPVGALIETPHWHDVLHTLDTRRRVSAVQVAPATRIAISEEFGMKPGTVSTGRMIRARGIAFGALSEEGHFDNPFGESTGAAQIFGASGGVMEAVVRTASHLIGAESSLPLEWHQLRGVSMSVKTAEIPGIGKVAICNGIAAAQQILETETWRDEFVAIEVMACVGGCLGGGGEPKSMDPLILQKRMQAIYELDKNSPRRRSYENQDVQKLYATELKEPNSVHAHELLHTSYAARNSKRLLLMRFLDCVDRRDASGAVSLFYPDAMWSTASPFADIQGTSNIGALINTRLPPRKLGPRYVRHRMESAADIDDLTVVTPTGERCRFSMEVDTMHEENQSRMVIRSLVREIL